VFCIFYFFSSYYAYDSILIINNCYYSFIVTIIQGVYPGQRYIASQGPMPDTVVDFWKMLWDNNVKIVIMACNEFEGIPRKVRSFFICHLSKTFFLLVCSQCFCFHAFLCAYLFYM